MGKPTFNLTDTIRFHNRRVGRSEQTAGSPLPVTVVGAVRRQGGGLFVESWPEVKKRMSRLQQSCRQCGTCCRGGGPALHLDDLHLVRSGKLPRKRLITLRRGELAHNPLAGRLEPLADELVKIAGQPGSWECFFHSAAKGCLIYRDRPQACRVLQCWDTEAISALVAKQTLTRRMILGEGSSWLPFIAEHEQLCPCDGLELLLTDPGGVDQKMRQKSARQANADLSFRMEVAARSSLPLSEELFVFGRPFFQLLQQLGVGVTESAKGLQLHWPGGSDFPS